ncbi:MAG: glutamate--tRNA ligase [Candidatus Taylorbacteria bacterium]
MNDKPVVTRFAPSPTGLFHAGSYRAALFAYIFARQNKGKFILRIEDTDKERSRKEYEDNIIDSLKWLGLEYDEFYRQSERTEIYRKYLKQLVDTGHAYLSKETPGIAAVVGKDGEIRDEQVSRRSEVIRFKNPNKKVAFDDLIRGRVEFDTTELGDFVIAKSMEEPIFHLVNVVDDYEMGMTHIIRGEDHISNTPRQILIYEAIGAPVPMFAHIPLLLSSERAKLSKRHGAVPISSYREKGYLPGAIINFMALLGWHPVDDREVLSLPEIIEQFSLERVQKSGAIFNDEKLKWFNKQYISKSSDTDFVEHAKVFVPEWLSTSSTTFKKMLPLLKEKISAFSEITDLLGQGGELHFVHDYESVPADKLLWKKNPDREVARKHLQECRDMISKIEDNDQLSAESIKTSIWPYAEANGKGDVLWPLRMSLSGQDRSPDPFNCIYILGITESLKRIDSAIQSLS